MAQTIIVNSLPEETRMAIVEDDRLAELVIERPDDSHLVGNIYKGRVQNILPGMQAAFVDIGIDKNAFLYIGDLRECELSMFAKGIRLKRAIYKDAADKKALMALAERASYRIVLPSGYNKEAIKKAIASFEAELDVVIWKVTPKSRKEVEVKQYMAAPIKFVEGEQDEILMDILITPQGSVKPEQILRALYDMFGFPIEVETVQIERTGLFCRRNGKWTALIA
ncbi:MAG: DUF2344 domain-containing protein [Selenomonadales bacterium]|nr:DUF2344 domain-containing protein [Selenomonadales bacterium]